MNLSAIFIDRPVATTLLAIGICLAGFFAFRTLPVAPLPQIEFPTIAVNAKLPGASPEIIASSVVTPLEKRLGQIAGVVEMTSASNVGSARIILQFDLSRDINGAARDVQAAINAARSDLPTDLPAQPSYRLVNPADPPIIILGVTSSISLVSDLYDVASTALQQDILQIKGVGDVIVGGGSLPAIRVEIDPHKLSHYGLGLDDVRSVIRSQNVLSPKGQITTSDLTFSIVANDQLFSPEDYQNLVITYQNGRPLYLRDIADVSRSIEDLTQFGMVNDEPAVLLVIFKQPGANIVETVDRIKGNLPRLKGYLSPLMDIKIVQDRTTTIRSALADVEHTLILSVILVVMVIYLFLHSVRAAFVAALVIPLSLLGTFALMYLGGYSLDNLSLMALTIAIGFVIDDAVVVIENIMRHIERREKPLQAALKGARDVGFTVISMSVSLVAVFLPILLMRGIVGRLFREFAIVLTLAILISMIVSVTATPVFAAQYLQPRRQSTSSFERWVANITALYGQSLGKILQSRTTVMMTVLGTMIATVALFIMVPKGFFPQQDTGRITGTMIADEDSSFDHIKKKLRERVHLLNQDPAIESVCAIMGFMNLPSNSANFYITLKPLSKRHESVDEVMARLRVSLGHMAGASLILKSAQDLSIGGRNTNALYQYTLRSTDLATINTWSPQILERLATMAVLRDVNSDQLSKGMSTRLTIDRMRAASYGISVLQFDQALYDAFGQRQISNLYTPINQYHVVMELAPEYWYRPSILNALFVKSSTGNMVPLTSLADYVNQTSLLVVNHQGQSPAATISFNLPAGVALGTAVDAIESEVAKLKLPENIVGSFSGMAQAFRESLSNQPYLILAALFVVYCVLGILYESLIHPLTILSTLPSAGVGALLALYFTGTDLSLMGLIGIFLLIGIVKKNAIMMIDVALTLEREQKLSAERAIYQACLIRFRPIMMTTAAALMSALPMAIGLGQGAELRRPLGISIVGGLLLSQVLTLYTTPVLYLVFSALNWRKFWPFPQRKQGVSHT